MGEEISARIAPSTRKYVYPSERTDSPADSLNVDLMCQSLIELYRVIKKKIQEKFVARGIVRKEVKYVDDYYDLNEYRKIIAKLGIKGLRESGELFDKYGIFVREKGSDAFVKKICLENIISFYLRVQAFVNQQI